MPVERAPAHPIRRRLRIAAAAAVVDMQAAAVVVVDTPVAVAVVDMPAVAAADDGNL
jgi:hypothetical protein